MRTRLEVSRAAPGVYIMADNDESAAECERRLSEAFSDRKDAWPLCVKGLPGNGFPTSFVAHDLILLAVALLIACWPD